MPDAPSLDETPMHAFRSTTTLRPLVAAIALLATTVACGASDASVTGPDDDTGTPPPASKGIVSGRVTDALGRPIAGASVVINNAVWFNRNIVLTSGADGTYRYEMPPTDSWYVRGTTDVSYNGRTYRMELKPDYAGSFSGVDGRVVNLQWTMTGAVPTDFGHSGFYGGSVEIDAGWDLSDLAGVSLTLTPVGKLIDGSTGTTITRAITGDASSFALRDVPIGRYKVSATRNGVPLVIRMRHSSQYVADVTADFEPAYAGATSYGIYFMVATTDW
jgi:hypothetical protein